MTLDFIIIGMLNHLAKYHQSVLLSEKLSNVDGVTGPMDKYTAAIQKPLGNKVTESEFRELLANLIVNQNLAFSIVDSEDFRVFCQRMNREDFSVSRKTIKTSIENIYKAKKEKIHAILNDFDSSFSICTDVWTSKNQIPFLGVTIHFINSNWQKVTLLIGFVYLDGSHSGVNLASEIAILLRGYGILNRLISITTDNASSNNTLTAAMDTECENIDSLYQSNWGHIR